MKNRALLLLLLSCLCSCQNDKPEVAPASPLTWELVKLTTMSRANPSVTMTGPDLPWQETYVFQPDSTFRKRRQQGQQVEEASGTYSITSYGPGFVYRRLLTLNYTSTSDLVATCIGSPQEIIGELNDTTLIGSTEACHGPRLEYRKR